MRTTLVKTPLKDLYKVEIAPFEDLRGFFIEPWHKKDFKEAGLDIDFVQEGHSKSGKNILRGLHYQNMSAPMAKLIRCTHGRIYDVVVDIRSKSPTYGKWYGIELSEENKIQLFVPIGFAHGFLSLTNGAEVQYKQSGYYTPSAEGSIAWNDPSIGIKWPKGNFILSEKDKKAESFINYKKHPVFS